MVYPTSAIDALAHEGFAVDYMATTPANAPAIPELAAVDGRALTTAD